MFRPLSLVAFVVIAVHASPAFAQPAATATPTGAIQGRVLFGNEPFPGVLVIARSALGAGTERRATTDDLGKFRFATLPAGRYRLEAVLDGFPPATREVDVGDGIAAIDLQLAFSELIEIEGKSAAETLRESAEAVLVVETDLAKKESADLGEVMSRSQGVGVRRSGGFGSYARISLAGLTDDQIRFFLDGVPLELAGYPFGLANVPVNVIDRVETYRGVVPIRFGADALGGAINLVGDEDIAGTHASASYQLGSFNSHRATLAARHRDATSGLHARLGGFADRARNDYAVDVEVPDERGRLSPARVRRFHDGYGALGGNVEVGITDRPWVRQLVARAFATAYEKELQHNLVMTIPYGAVRYGERTAGGTVRYERGFGRAGTLDLLGGYTYGRLAFLDVGECVYDWFGECVRERRQHGEIESRPHDQVFWEHAAFAQAHVAVPFGERQRIELSLSPTFVTRTGDERRQADPVGRDPLSAQRDLVTVVGGGEHEVDLLGDHLENLAFVKGYLQLARTEETLPGGFFRERDRDTFRCGAGNALRYRLDERWYAKASYEYATRLPRPDEIFGDGVLVVANLELAPETSHNANLGVTLDARETPTGAWRGDVNTFLRAADQLIVLLGNDRVFSYQNVFGARSLGVEAAAGWTSSSGHLALDGNLTYLDFRNTSSAGTFGDFAGDRIPNRPYLFANGAAQLHYGRVDGKDDEVTVAWNTRYVHGFFRGWESVGLVEWKQVVPSQLLHSLAATYLIREPAFDLTVTVEVQNLTDERAFDFFGVQKPGRAFFVKTTVEL